jgi:hypothetical protein
VVNCSYSLASFLHLVESRAAACSAASLSFPILHLWQPVGLHNLPGHFIQRELPQIVAAAAASRDLN